MYRSWKLFVSLLAVIGPLFATACGSGSANIRLVNAYPATSNEDLLVDGKTTASSIGYGAGSAYSSVSSGSRHIQVETSGTTNILADLDSTLSGGSYNSALSTNNGTIILTDDHSTPSSGDVSLRVVNGAPLLGTVDVYIVASGQALPSTPTFSSMAFPSGSAYTSLAAGSYQVIFTLPGQQLAVLATSSLSFTAGQVRTIVALDALGGGLTTSVISDLN